MFQELFNAWPGLYVANKAFLNLIEQIELYKPFLSNLEHVKQKPITHFASLWKLNDMALRGNGIDLGRLVLDVLEWSAPIDHGIENAAQGPDIGFQWNLTIVFEKQKLNLLCNVLSHFRCRSRRLLRD